MPISRRREIGRRLMKLTPFEEKRDEDLPTAECGILKIVTETES